jgi:cyclopropane fatty-acyl-phospholipid synthase-like methyltransferase
MVSQDGSRIDTKERAPTKHIDIDTEVDEVVAHDVFDAVGDAVDADFIEVWKLSAITKE